jgi:agmatine/peptidylarginine deiminase
MKNILQRLSLLSSLFLLVSCQDFTLQGLPGTLFSSAADSQRQFKLPGEYDPIDAVIVSEHLATFRNGQEFMKALMDAKTDVWLLASSVPQVQQTRLIMQQRFHLTAEEMQQVKPLPVLTQTVWARDWAPLMAKNTRNASQWGLVDFKYYPDRTVDDASAERLTQVLNEHPPHLGWSTSAAPQFQRLPVPVELEGGNVMCNEQHCFVSQEVLLRLEERGETPNETQIIADLEKYLQQEFWIVPRMPFEGTGHIDIWAKFLNPTQVIVGEISDESMDLIPAEQAATYRAVQRFLEEQATGLDSTGAPVPNALASVLKREAPNVEILRIPMPTPGVYRGVETFRTYTNSLFVNKTAVVPRYQRGSRAERNNRDLLNEQEQTVEAIYRKAGFEVKWILADNLIRDGGAWHCVSMQVPDLIP